MNLLILIVPEITDSVLNNISVHVEFKQVYLSPEIQDRKAISCIQKFIVEFIYFNLNDTDES